MLLLLSALIVAGAVAWSGQKIAREVRARREPESMRVTQLLAIFAPAAAAADDARALLAWSPVAAAARRLFPAEFAALDRAAGGAFPFTPEQVQAAHARWTADWLAWERTHDADSRLKALAAEAELRDEASTPYGRARLEAVEREKLETYQRRYEEYTRVSRALRRLMERQGGSAPVEAG